MHRSRSAGFPFLGALTQALRYIGVAVGVGAVLATVFTIWTPEATTQESPLGPLAGLLVPPATAAPTATLPPVLPTPERTGPLVGIVAGHLGGTDTGAVCTDGTTEVDINKDIATRVMVGLQSNGFRVDLLDEFDSRLADYRALAVVSIHNDSCDYINELATGFKVAGAKNSGVPAESQRLAACLTDRYAKATGLPFHAGSVTPDMTQYHTFYEVSPDTPIAIIETGFMYLDRRILKEEPQKVAQGVIDGLLCFALGQPITSTPSP
jgi:N-acetylmuramoyl-L-alanine amidase